MQIEYLIFNLHAVKSLPMLKRTLEKALKKAARTYPIVTVTGPRQSGKTTLVRAAFPRHAYVSLEDRDHREYAAEDSRGFLAQYDGKLILDEAQRAPSLFSYIQTSVDVKASAGRYILSGSQNFLLLRSVSQSLAGRCAILHLLPLSQSEILRRSPLGAKHLGERIPGKQRHGEDSLMDRLFTGFYPRIHDESLSPRRWYQGYCQAYVERDVRELVNVGDTETFHRFVRLCAGRNGQILNLTSLGNDCGVSHTTAKRWISILESSFLLMQLRPHDENFSKRMIKSPKLYFLDTGLLCYLLGIHDAKELHHHSARGSIFESFVISELLKSYLNDWEDHRVYFWRDSAGHEVDVLLERGEKLIPLEIKSGQTFASDFLKGLMRWPELAGKKAGPGAVVHGGRESFRRSGFACYSWASL